MTTAPPTRLRRRVALTLSGLLLLLAVSGCGHSSHATASTVAGTPPDFDFGANDPLRATAFGDSITLGVVDAPDGRTFVTDNNYPSILQTMLRGQNSHWRVVNRGVAGERTATGASRLPGVLAADHPGYVLVMEGTNDAGAHDDPAAIVANLQAMVGQARANKTIPIVGTIPPDFRSDQIARTIIDQANTMIRTLATSQRVALAEIFDGMNDRSLFGQTPAADPLHPNERGYSVMAGIWFSALQRAFPGGAPPATLALRPQSR